MSQDFPLPRELLKEFLVTPTEHSACHAFATRMVEHTVREFELLSYVEDGKVNPMRWKTQARRGTKTVYRERDVGGMGESLADSVHRCASELPIFQPTAATLTPSTMLLTGVGQGHVENVMNTLVTTSQEELALVVEYLHGGVTDCGVLHAMESPTEAEPFRFLGFKFFVSKAVSNPRLVKRRHSVYLEATGTTRTSSGEVLGYHIMQSVALPNFPDLTERNSVCALISARFLYRQKRPGLVEIFGLSNIEIGLAIKHIGHFYAAETMLGMTRVLDCSETKRFTLMARSFQSLKRRRGTANSMSTDEPSGDKATRCSVCQRIGRHGGFGAAKLIDCLVCGREVCPRCRSPKQVFVSNHDGVMGRLIKVPVCSACSLEANMSCQQQQRDERLYSTILEKSPGQGQGSRRSFNQHVLSPEGRQTPRDSPTSLRKYLATPKTEVSTPRSDSASRQTWTSTPSRRRLVRLMPEDGIGASQERKPVPLQEGMQWVLRYQSPSLSRHTSK